MSDPSDNAYAVLALDPGAGEDEIRRRYKRLCAVFDPEGPVIYGLYRPAEAHDELARLKAAWQTLMDPELRRRHDQRLFPVDHPSRRRADQRPGLAAPAAPVERPRDPLAALGLPAETLLTGEVLGRVRIVCGVRLEEIAERTKIGMFTLRSIEADRYADLPAPVYLKGFVKQIAEFLSLDPAKAVRDYLTGFEDWQRERARNRGW